MGIFVIGNDALDGGDPREADNKNGLGEIPSR
jgi:hypothetical protein